MKFLVLTSNDQGSIMEASSWESAKLKVKKRFKNFDQVKLIALNKSNSIQKGGDDPAKTVQTKTVQNIEFRNRLVNEIKKDFCMDGSKQSNINNLIDIAYNLNEATNTISSMLQLKEKISNLNSTKASSAGIDMIRDNEGGSDSSDIISSTQKMQNKLINNETKTKSSNEKKYTKIELINTTQDNKGPTIDTDSDTISFKKIDDKKSKIDTTKQPIIDTDSDASSKISTETPNKVESECESINNEDSDTKPRKKKTNKKSSRRNSSDAPACILM